MGERACLPTALTSTTTTPPRGQAPVTFFCPCQVPTSLSAFVLTSPQISEGLTHFCHYSGPHSNVPSSERPLLKLPHLRWCHPLTPLNQIYHPVFFLLVLEAICKHLHQLVFAHPADTPEGTLIHSDATKDLNFIHVTRKQFKRNEETTV